MKLYFIAIVPGQELRDQIRALKEEVKEKYGAKHALKIPAHITLQIPFKHAEEEEPELIRELETFARGKEPFEVELSGFDSFPPRVIFIRIVNHLPVVRLHNELQKVMNNLTGQDNRKKSSPVHPHVTIASRDLSKKAYREAWPEFKNRNFEARFDVSSFHLLKHNGKVWELHREISFRE